MSGLQVSKLRAEIRELRIRNARLRELVELLASRTALLSQRVERSANATAVISSFETFSTSSIPRPRTTRQSLEDVPGFSPIRDCDWFPIFDSGFEPLDPNPGWKCLSDHHTPIRIGFLLFGVDHDGIEQSVQRVEQRQLRRRDFIPIFVTDSTDFGPFRSRGYVFEHIPAAIVQSPGSRRAERRYLRRRLELIKSKWGIGELVDLSSSTP
jgi:hypothetical protein